MCTFKSVAEKGQDSSTMNIGIPKELNRYSQQGRQEEGKGLRNVLNERGGRFANKVVVEVADQRNLQGRRLMLVLVFGHGIVPPFMEGMAAGNPAYSHP